MTIENEIINEANLHVAKYALREELLQKRKFEGCRCNKCRLDWEDAIDRVDWAAEMGNWLPRLKIVKKGKETHIVDDDDVQKMFIQ